MSQVFSALVVPGTRAVRIRFLRSQLDRHVNVTQSLDLGFQQAPEDSEPRYLAEKIRVLVDLLHSINELPQRLFRGRTGDRLGGCCDCKRLACLGGATGTASGD